MLLLFMSACELDHSAPSSGCGGRIGGSNNENMTYRSDVQLGQVTGAIYPGRQNQSDNSGSLIFWSTLVVADTAARSSGFSFSEVWGTTPSVLSEWVTVNIAPFGTIRVPKWFADVVAVALSR